MDYTFGQIEKELVENGRIWESNRIASRSTARDFRRIARWREIAKNAGFSPVAINALEMAGERRDTRFTGSTPEMERMGVEDYGVGVRLLLYNVKTVNRNYGSTMRVFDLVKMGYWPHDISYLRSLWECGKSLYSDTKQQLLLWDWELQDSIKKKWGALWKSK